jgi:hypothetical protein
LSKITAILLGALLMQGCATGYHSATNPILGFTGGFMHQEGPGELIEVAFYGNGFTKGEKTGLYLMYRCAELVQERGGDHFVMYRGIPYAIADRPEANAYISSLTGKPTAKVFILLEDSAREHSFSANKIIELHTAEVKGK